MIFNEAYGIIYDSEEEKREAQLKAIAHWRCSQATTHAISGLLEFTSVVVQMEGAEEDELFERFGSELQWRFQKGDCWSVIIGSVSLKTVDARLRFAQINSRIVMFCSATEGTLGAYVLNSWLLNHCNPLTTDGERAKCTSSEFDRCIRFLK